MKIAVCDDIKEYRDCVKDYSNEYFSGKNIECEIFEFENGHSLLESDTEFDILFLDIELTDSNGIDIAKQIQSISKNTVILIITSHHEYLDAAMDLNVTRYIDKPITRQRLFSALDKATQVINEKIISLRTTQNSIIRLKVSNIVFAEAKLKRVAIYTCENTVYTVKESLKDVRNMLSGSNFATPHNSYIINLDYVKSFKRNEVVLSFSGKEVKISVATRKQAEFKKRFLDYIGEGEK